MLSGGGADRGGEMLRKLLIGGLVAIGLYLALILMFWPGSEHSDFALQTVNAAPRDYAAALAAVGCPLLVIVGSEDEAFHADRFAPIVRAHSDGEVLVYEGESHSSILHADAAIAAIADWMKAF